MGAAYTELMQESQRDWLVSLSFQEQVLEGDRAQLLPSCSPLAPYAW
jgi:hypothetical protein